MTFIILAELVARMEEEKAAIHAEYEQERIAYQKLLKDYNLLETANDDLKDRVTMLRGGGKSDRAVSNLSMTSSLMTEEDATLLEAEEEIKKLLEIIAENQDTILKKDKNIIMLQNIITQGRISCHYRNCWHIYIQSEFHVEQMYKTNI